VKFRSALFVFFFFIMVVVVAAACRRDDRARADGVVDAAALDAEDVKVTLPSSSSSSSSQPPTPTESASVGQAALPPPTSQPSDAGVDFTERASMKTWALARIREAAKGPPKSAELVRIPITRHGPGWGCICPEVYIGIKNSADTDTIWIEPTFAPTATPLAPDTAVVAEGYFTGKSTPFAPKTTEAFEKVSLHGFHVLRHRPVAFDPNSEGPQPMAADARASTVLTAAEAHHETTEPSDGRVFLLVSASIPMHEKNAQAAAMKKRDDLRANGFADAEVLDSRTTSGLFCCHWVVVVSRHRTAADASADAAKAKAKKIDTLVRRGW
jgi:hypothetical protein